MIAELDALLTSGSWPFVLQHHIQARRRLDGEFQSWQWADQMVVFYPKP